MATNTEKIDKLSNDLNNLNTRVEREFGLFDQTSTNQEQKIKELELQREKLLERCHELELKVVALETRTNSIEKGGDRRWQLAPMVITILVALVNVILTLTLGRK